MKRRRLYDLVVSLLTDYPILRDSDKLLTWQIWGYGEYLESGYITKESFLLAPSVETIARCRRKAQELNPNLRPSKERMEQRAGIEQSKGQFIFDEDV